MGFRPENESSSMSFASTVFRRATSVWSGVDIATTSTDSLIAPVCSVTSTVRLADASIGTPVFTHFLKPASSTATSYVPGVSDVNT